MNTLGSEDYEQFNRVGAGFERLCAQRILITGGTGFVGSWLLEALLHLNRQYAAGIRLFVLTRRPRRFLAARPHLASDSAVEVIEGDILEAERWAPQIPALDMLFHGAFDSGLTPGTLTRLQVLDTIIEGTRKVLSVAARLGARRVLFVSSGAVYGDMPEGVQRFSESDTSGPDPLSAKGAYAEGKRAAEAWGLAFCEDQQIEFLIARLFAFAGPFLPLDQHFAFGNFLRDCLRGGPISVSGSGRSVRSYLYGADLAIWLVKMLASEISGRAFNVGSDEAVSIRELAELFRDLGGIKSAVQIGMEANPGELVSRYVPDISRAQQELHLDVCTALPESIERSLRYYRR